MALLIVPALALVLVFSVLVTAVLHAPDGAPTGALARPAALLSVYLLCYANIVLVGEITNSFYQLNNAWLWLGLHAALALAAWFVWRWKGRPSLRAPWADTEGRILPAGGWQSLRQWPDVWALGVGVITVLLFSLVLIWVVPPNTNDSLATHMARIGYWLQRGAFFPWPSHRVWQISYPVDMQLQMFWTVLFIGTDRIVEIVQWLGTLAAMVAVFGLARLLGAARPQAFFAAFIWATFPEIILESSTTQNDLVAGTLFAAMLYLLFLGLSKRSAPVLALSGLALGLGMGTKQTLVFLLPGLVLILCLLLWYCWKDAFHRGGLFFRLLNWGAIGIGAFLLLGLYMFVVNQINFGHPMGPETAVDAQTGGQTSQSLVQNLVYNSFRLTYQAIDPSGLPDPLAGYSVKAKALVVGKIVNALHFRVEDPVAVAVGHQFSLRERYLMQEDVAWYGPLFALLVMPLTLYLFIQGLRKREVLRMSLFVLAVTFLLCDAAFRPGWDPAQGRYFIPVVMVTTPAVALLVRRGWGGAVLRWFIASLALVIAITTFQLNSGKPLSGEYNIWQTSRLDQITMQSFYMRQPARMVDSLVPADATLGLLNYGTYLEYPFFRENFSRRLVQIYPPERIQDVNWLKDQGIEYVLIQAGPEDPPVNALGELVPVANTGEWTLMTWAAEK